MRPGQYGLARLAEDDAARERIAFDVELRPAAAAPLSLLQKAFGDVEHDRPRHHFVHQTDLLRAPPLELFAVEDDVQRRRQSDQPGEFRRAAPGGKDAE